MQRNDLQRPRGEIRFALACCPLFALGGCANAAAPSFVLFGAYFPAWMFCAFVGIAVAIAARVVMLTSGFVRVVPFQLFVCVAIGLGAAIAFWLLRFGR